MLTADEAKKVRALGIGKRALEAMLATARREGAEAEREACVAIIAARRAPIPVCSCCASGADRRAVDELAAVESLICDRAKDGAT